MGNRSAAVISKPVVLVLALLVIANYYLFRYAIPRWDSVTGALLVALSFAVMAGMALYIRARLRS